MMRTKILIMGLPGAGKTTLAQEIKRRLDLEGKQVAWFNADIVRRENNDWDFSAEGRLRQSERMRELSESVLVDYVICDFVAPTQEIRKIFSADYVIWVNTIPFSRYEDTNQMFEPPVKYNFCVTSKDAVAWSKKIIEHIHSLESAEVL